MTFTDYSSIGIMYLTKWVYLNTFQRYRAYTYTQTTLRSHFYEWFCGVL